ncbi:polysaccharide deacetylase family protein [Roseovarius sp. Pro17]|uniref:polysaccharide deacetylase family protein n=1 Tax=Roseovarius sp. Pro17 TaxID=3108175 RepID=UPI002D7A0666|nr:polysaccharide deacetylase family protein [Roseovarius sp. Pro17]
MRDRLNLIAATLVASRPLIIAQDKPTVSISFDDAPRSACQLGASLTEDAGGRSTYYIAGKFANSDALSDYSVDDLYQLNEAGHEICCHGYSHLDYRKYPLDVLRTDIERNAGFFQDNGLPQPRHFAFPFGAVSPKAKALCAEKFDTCRGIKPIVMRKKLDKALLCSIPLYAKHWNYAVYKAQIEDVHKNGGWLLFYTHKVTDDPGPYDTTPNMLKELLKMTNDFDIPIKTVSEAISYLAME